jgi:NAD(P)-dependent dehydrogenase (short-subunit alcohol dehydrogenase family)
MSFRGLSHRFKQEVIVNLYYKIIEIMAVKQTIAFIGAADELCTVLVKKLAAAGYPLLFISNDGIRYQELADQIKSDTPDADIEITDCAKEGCWEADIIALYDNTTLAKELIERIKTVATQKVVICISTAGSNSSSLIKTTDLQQMLPNSKVIQISHDIEGLELQISGADNEAMELVSALFENSGFIIAETLLNR